ncbi:hypothetical protein PMIN04_010061 [Paraphaeosphaeria minitans]
MRYTSIAAAAVLACASRTAAHSWIQQIVKVKDNGSYVGDWGYPRGFCAKGDTCDPGTVNNFQIPSNDANELFITEKDSLCKDSQRKPVQLDTAKYPRLKAAPGMHIALRYAENGHVSLNGTPKEDTNKFKPNAGGTVFIYGTTDPKEDEKLVNVLRWTKVGNGGDGRGVLLATNDFDDGRCYEANGSPISMQRAAANPSYAKGQTGQGTGEFGLPCESNVLLPKNLTAGKPYTLYWVWQWNTPPGKDQNRWKGKDEYYSTCMDVDIADTFATEAIADAKYFSPQQDDTSAAVKSFADRTAQYTNPIKGEIGPVFSQDQTATGAPSASGPASTAPIPTPTDVSSMTTRLGNSQPSSGPSTGLDGNGGSGYGNGNESNGNAVTVTDIVYITVTAPNNASSTLSTVSVPTSENVPDTSLLQSTGKAPAPTDVPAMAQRPGTAQPTARAVPLRGPVPFRGRFYRV